jgi:preprotein translocase subunit SecA
LPTVAPPSGDGDGGGEALVAPVEVDRKEVLRSWLRSSYHLELDGLGMEMDGRARDQVEPVVANIVVAYDKRYQEKVAEIGEEAMRRIERFILLLKIDEKWKDHLHAMDHLRHGISLRGYGQIDPKVAYKQEGYQMFSELIGNLRTEITELLFRVQVRKRTPRLGTNLIGPSTRRTTWRPLRRPRPRVRWRVLAPGQAATAESTEPVKPIRNVAPRWAE